MKCFKLFLQLLLVICLVVTLIAGLSESVQAANVCCEQTKDNEYCQYVDETQCAGGSKMAPTSCDQTSYCKLGCCYDKEGEGYCYSSYPRAMCEKQYSGIFVDEQNCNKVSECEKGCCIIGTQADFVTENRCKKETAEFADLTMDFRSDIKTEQKCIEVAHTADKGCCVSESGCRYVTDAECAISPQSISLALNASENITIGASYTTGFYKDKYCSQLGFCSCTPSSPSLKGTANPKNTGCIEGSDDVYWIDSCGNPEGVAYDCDYALGTLCGDRDGNEEYICEDISCVKNGKGDQTLIKFSNDEEDYEEVSVGGILNGESWCFYDYSFPKVKTKISGGQKVTDIKNLADVLVDYDKKIVANLESNLPEGYDFSLQSISENLREIDYASREPIGSRHYRAICINGKQLVEPCGDYRTEWCLQGNVEGEGKFSLKKEYTEARCIENKWQSCIDDCNTATPDMSNDDWEKAQLKDLECCADYSKRDCAWIGGKCVPRVSPGTKFWEEEGENNCGKANMECSFLVKCDGWSSIFGICEDVGDNILSSGWHPIDEDGNAIENLEEIPCFKKDDDGKIAFIQAANNLCRSYGDCGADLNLAGVYSYPGFSSPIDLGSKFENFIGDKLLDSQINKNNKPNWEQGSEILDTRLHEDKYNGFSGSFVDFFRSASQGGGRGIFYGSGLIAAPILAQLKVWPSVFGTKFTQGFVFGFTGASDPELLKIMEIGENTLIAKGKKTLGEEGVDKLKKEVITHLGEDATSDQIAVGVNDALLERGKEEALSKGFLGTTLEVVNIAMWVYLVYDLVNNFASDTQTVTVSTECKPWTAPQVVDDCEKCNPNFWKDDDGVPENVNAFKACSEYRCKSFGATCELINKGTTNETCVSLSHYDVTSPVIVPWTKEMEEDLTIQELDYGFAIGYKNSIEDKKVDKNEYKTASNI